MKIQRRVPNPNGKNPFWFDDFHTHTSARKWDSSGGNSVEKDPYTLILSIHSSGIYLFSEPGDTFLSATRVLLHFVFLYGWLVLGGISILKWTRSPVLTFIICYGTEAEISSLCLHLPEEKEFWVFLT
jgi:hypothetical protein